MLSQIKVYFIAVTILIFCLVMVRILNSRIKDFEVTISSFGLKKTNGTAIQQQQQQPRIDELKETDSYYSLHRLEGLKKQQTFKKQIHFYKNKEPKVAHFFPLYKDFMGKNLTFETDNQNPYLKEEQFNFYQAAILSGALNITQIAMAQFVSNLTSYKLERLGGQPINTVKDLGDEMESEFVLLNATNKIFYVGDTVAVRVDVFSTLKVPNLVGGDEIRVWVKDQTKGASMAVQVEDLRNGSYIARLPLLLPGNVSIFASLAYPKEILKSIFFLRVIMGAIRLNAGGFVSQESSEATLCSPFPIDYHGNGLCNLTKANQGRSWFCGKPRNPKLTCEHWNDTRDMEFPYPLPVGQAEQDWFDMISMGKKHYLRALQDYVIRLRVYRRKATASTRLPKPYCGNRPPRHTWTEGAPRGMFYRMSWVPFGCKIKRHSFHALTEALKNHTIQFIGDSNLLSWVDIFQKNKMCSPDQDPIDKVTGRVKTWHDPTYCYNERYNLTVQWRTHGLPFHTNPDHWASRVNLQSAATTLDNLPLTDKTIILIHMFMHFSTQHYSVFLDRIRATRDAIKRLFKRNPTVKVFIRGPHVAYKEWPASMGGDAQGPLFLRILREEFVDLYDKVYLLDFWDMTIAGENQEFHPTTLITLQMIDLFFGYLIDK